MKHGWRVVVALAWISWLHSTLPSKEVDKWTPTGSVEALEECKRLAVTAAENAVRRLREQNDGVVYDYVHSGAVIEVTFPSGERGSHVFVCLPDTVDPREPKGK